mmetsp:Transcript_64380/g.135145  ORF Transcript_64380/g.135145 Transcript_64380/m.135145 type:complete len:227 (-) Transcript_64380:272-952(-)
MPFWGWGAAPAEQPRPVAAVVATPAAAPATVSPPAAYHGASPAAMPSPPPAPQTPREQCPPCPSHFDGLGARSQHELQQLKEYPNLQDDIVADHPAAARCAQKAKELHSENESLALQLVNKQAVFDDALAKCRSAQQELDATKAEVQALLAKKNELLARESPDQMATILLSTANHIDGEAENLLHESLKAPGTLDTAALASLKESYIKQKTDKHWRMALEKSIKMR